MSNFEQARSLFERSSKALQEAMRVLENQMGEDKLKRRGWSRVSKTDQDGRKIQVWLRGKRDDRQDQE